MEQLFNNIYVLAAYGFLIYTVVLFVMEKDDYDDANEHFSIKKYFNRNWDNWLLSLILVPIIATKAGELWLGAMDIAGKSWRFFIIYYLGVGAIVEMLYTAIKWIRNKRKKLND